MESVSQSVSHKFRLGLKKKTIYGVLGLLHGSLLIVITRRVRQGEIAGHTVWRVDAVDVLPLKAAAAAADDDQQTTWLIRALTQVLSTPYFYFSYTADLTQTQQRIALSKNLDRPLLERADARFVWNQPLLADLRAASPDLLPYLIPLLHGAVFINKCSLNGKSFVWTIVSRRSRFRVGARLFLRGCNDQGQVANYVETEQLVEYGTATSSFVQTRGSMPMFWQQWPNLQYKPRPKMTQQDSISGRERM